MNFVTGANCNYIPTQIGDGEGMVEGSKKKIQCDVYIKLVTQKKNLLVNEKKRDVGMAKHISETRDELSITLYLQSEIKFF